ncbi:hypothetical protein IMZ11_40650 [Microtetraspora sp. AC03309]|uniref:sensor histidine kinase n=1 Tax=Microtetraspora sp. AC03309 TaxID=2779376 RepID=UPI001E5DDB9D|nr:histidine kinase [Microtetraspora sp. AC03309]MCC5581931.1 hypothetical protein [Microtetraspora sp. AC03309]
MIVLLHRIEQLNARAAEIARQAVIKARELFADDVHDLIGSRLWLAALRGEMARRLADEGSSLRAELAELVTSIHQAASEIRDIARTYREISLKTELSHARAVLRVFGIDCRIVGAELAPATAADKVLAVIVREAIANVLRHSKARICVIEVSRHGDRVRLTIENDGVEPAQGSENDWELAGLRRRATMVGGTVEVIAGSADRFRLSVEIPEQLR